MGRSIKEKKSVFEVARKQFPIGRFAPASIQKDRFESYDNREKKSDKVAAEKQEERMEILSLVDVVFKYGTHEEAPHFWFLDHKNMDMSRASLTKFSNVTVHVPNPCADSIVSTPSYKKLSKKYGSRLELSGCTAEQQLRYIADAFATPTLQSYAPGLSLVWYDTCGKCLDEQFQTIELFARLHLMRRFGPSVFAVTFTHRDLNDHMDKKTKAKHTHPKRMLVDDWIVQCFKAEGYTAHKSSRLRFPRVKEGVYTWIYIIIPPMWKPSLDTFCEMDQDVNQYLIDYSFRGGDYPIVSIKTYQGKPLLLQEKRDTETERLNRMYACWKK